MKNRYLFFFLLLFIGSCSVYNYKSTYHPPSILFDETDLSRNSEAWDFYLHDGYGRSHKVDSISIDSSSINTILEAPVPIDLPEILRPSEDARKKEVHVFVKKLNLDTNTPVEFEPIDIEKVMMYSNPHSQVEPQVENQRAPESIEKNESKAALKVALIVVGAIVFGGMLIGLVFRALIRNACYISTMAYGSYDAPEVLVLRRFRDEKLSKTFFGRVFIGNYYAFSPLLVKFVKKTGIAEKFIRKKLDGFVNRLKVKNNW